MKWLLSSFCLLTCASTGLLQSAIGSRNELETSNATQAHRESIVVNDDARENSTFSRTSVNFPKSTKSMLNASTQSNHTHDQTSLFLDGFLSSLTVSVLSELGDRSFFTAIILSITYSRTLVFFGQMAAQTIMTATSVGLSFVTRLVPRWITHYLSIGLFIAFGLKMLYEAIVQFRFETTDVVDLERKVEAETRRKKFTGAFLAAFSLTLVAECGDRSQISTVVLAATKSALAVGLGTVLAHAVTTLSAVAAGRAIASVISVKYLTLAASFIFFSFAIVASVEGYGWR